MAIIDWPTTRPFQGARLELDLAVSRAGFAGYYTGNRQTISHLADRRTATLTLPPCKGADGPARQAFLHGLLSRGDWLRMGMQHQPYPRGDLRGSPTVAASVAAGARSLVLTGGVSALNLVQNPSFERATLAPWTKSATGSHVGVRSADTTVAPLYSLLLVNTVAGQDSYYYQSVPCQPSTTYTLTAQVFVQSIVAGATENRCLALYDFGAGGYAQDGTLSASHVLSTWTNHAVTVTTGSTATALEVRLYSPRGSVYYDAVQLAPGPSALAAFYPWPTLLGGDWLGVGGNLLQVDYAGSSRNSDDNIVVPLVSPLQRPITAGAAVTWANPTGLWELDADSLPLNFNPGAVADGVALPLREVFA